MAQFLRLSATKGINVEKIISWEDRAPTSPSAGSRLWITYAYGAGGSLGFEPYQECYSGAERDAFLAYLGAQCGWWNMNPPMRDPDEHDYDADHTAGLEDTGEIER